MRLWAQVTVTLGVNLLGIALLILVLLQQQTRSGIDSFLYAPARERVRDLGRQVEEEFPTLSPSERQDWLASLQAAQGVTLAIFDDTGRQVAGPAVTVPDPVMREIRRLRGRDADDPPRERPRGRRRGRNNPPMFLVKESGLWVGYHFPLNLVPGQPPVRHTLTATAPSLFGSPFFFDWIPWVIGLGLALAVTAACWVPLIRRFSRSLNAIQSASAEIAQGRFDVQIPVSGGGEFGDLAASVRRMASQLSQLVHGQRRFLADVAHELCAPLSRIQLSTGILGQADLPHRTALDRLEKDVAYMSALVGDLLSFTRGAVRQPELAPLSLAEIVQEAIALERAGQTDIVTDVSPGLVVVADREYLLRALGNVLRNAIGYAGFAGPIHIKATRVGNRVRLAVQDSGPGLPETDLESIFEPFSKPDGARTPGLGGAGLGLAIVKGCIEACSGSVSCRNRHPSGLEVVMDLPSPAPL